MNKATKQSKHTQETHQANAEEHIRRGIMDGRFVSGQRLIEIDLMRTLNISRGNVREAFRNLEAEGIISIEKHRGASVRKISREEVINVFEVLAAISLVAVEKVAQKVKDPRTREVLKESLSIAVNFRENLSQHRLVQDYMEENTRFWGSLSMLAGNSILEETRNRLQLPLYRLQVQGLIINSFKLKWITLHEEILSSLLSGEAEKAQQFAVEAQNDVRDAILALPNSAYSD